MVQVRPELPVQRVPEQVHARARVGGKPEPVDAPVGIVLDVWRLARAVDLVEHRDLRQRLHADRLENLVHLLDALGALRIGRVDDVQQQVGLASLLQRRAERGHQLVRQVADEADGVGEGHLAGRRRQRAAAARSGSSVAKSWSAAYAAGRGQRG